MLELRVAAVEEDGKPRGASGAEELGNDVDERDADVADKDDGGPDGSGGVQARACVWPTRDGGGVQREADGEWRGVAVAGLRGRWRGEGGEESVRLIGERGGVAMAGLQRRRGGREERGGGRREEGGRSPSAWGAASETKPQACTPKNRVMAGTHPLQSPSEQGVFSGVFHCFGACPMPPHLQNHHHHPLPPRTPSLTITFSAFLDPPCTLRSTHSLWPPPRRTPS